MSFQDTINKTDEYEIDLHIAKRKNCQHIDCIRVAIYGYPRGGCYVPKEERYGYNKGVKIFCKEHKKDNMAIVTNNQCYNKRCNKDASFYYIVDGNNVKACAQHKLDGMKNLKHRICKKCERRATYTVNKDEKPLYCSIHKPIGFKRHYFKYCKVDHCYARAKYSSKWTEKPSYCDRHKPKGWYINKTMSKCKHEGCLNVATQCYKKSKCHFIQFCKVHKLDGMIDYKLRTRICEYKACTEIKYKKSPYCYSHIVCNNASMQCNIDDTLTETSDEPLF